LSLLKRARLEARRAEVAEARSGNAAAGNAEFRHDLVLWLAKSPSKEMRTLAASSALKPVALWESTPGLPWQGPAWSWMARGDSESPGPALASAAALRQSRQRRLLEFLLVGLASVLIFSFLPRSQIVLRNTWPEQFLLVAVFGTWAWGLSVLGVLLAAIGVGGRLWWLGSRTVHWARMKWREPVEEATA
jgi:hypothetical protein